MRLHEFVLNPKTDANANLVTALELIRHRYRDQKQSPKISTSSLINLILNTDKNFNYDSLVAANEENPAVKNLIKSFNKDYVELIPIDSQETRAPTTNVGDQPTQAPVDTVSSMAKRAAKQRGAAM